MSETVIEFIKQCGAKETFVKSKDIALKRYDEFKTEMADRSRFEQQFEFELFVMGYLVSIFDSEDFFSERVDFVDIVEREYGKYVHNFLIDSLDSKLFSLNVPNSDIYAYRKLKSYEAEIVKLTQNPNYISQYLFSAFNMYPILKNEIIEEKCVTLLVDNIKWFQQIINSYLLKVKSDFEKLSN